jgi:hypothetical protein
LKKALVTIIAIFLLFGFIYLKNNETISYRLEGETYRLLVADETAEWTEGLMYKKSLTDADGMIFIFPGKNIRTFWNKNTYLNLDIYWLDDNQVVGRDFLPSIKKSKKTVTIQSPKAVNKVIEVVSNR